MAFQAFGSGMDIEQSFLSRTEGTMRQLASLIDLPPAQAGLAAALRRAFDLPADETERQFSELLQKLC
ncbi:MAG TPA: hypothetical protein VEB39_04655 [Sphingomicrobium sp.]|nr:hypothetical protein [Sphingomicrobium sp.]